MGVLYRVSMSVGMIEAVTGHLPVTSDDESVKDLSLYLPVAVFGYLGYLFGFETVVVIPFPIPYMDGFQFVFLLDELVFTVTYLRATVYTAVALIFLVHLASHVNVTARSWYDTLIIGGGFLLVAGSVYASLWGIYEAELYAESIIGVVLSITQLL
ncbi:MAG: hypothetical protein M8354_12025, partial [Halalkalicoccus sp.]|nr:hypothetical protein [Halalkalicoccus sp.]